VRRLLKILLVLLALGIVVILLVPTMTYYHDSTTRTKILHMVARELPSNASMAEMAVFMQRHTTNSVVDDAGGQLEYGGFVPQTASDRFWGDRKVEIILVINRDTKTLQRAQVQIFYTGL
jgi:hypothetical protein